MWRQFNARIFFQDMERSSLQNLSPSVFELGRRLDQELILIGTVDLVLLGSVLYLLHGLSTLLGEVAILLYLFPLYILMILFVRKSSQFKREWREQHPSLTA